MLDIETTFFFNLYERVYYKTQLLAIYMRRVYDKSQLLAIFDVSATLNKHSNNLQLYTTFRSLCKCQDQMESYDVGLRAAFS